MTMNKLKPRILIVEDTLIARQMAIRALASFDCDIDTADTGVAALSQFDQHQYALIFMDLGLPDMDGLTVTETMRKKEEQKHAHTPIIALTAHISDKFKQDSFEAGIDDFLSKPLTADQASKIMKRYITH